MHRRILQGPYAALGVAPNASHEQVRGAFLALTKQFHPARFGRMSNDVQKLSNEVFLGIKTAHDSMLKALGVAPRGTPAGKIQSGALPAVKLPVGQTAPLPRAQGTPQQTPIRGSSPVASRAGSPPTGTTPPQGIRAGSTPPHGIRAGSPPAGTTPPQGIRAGSRPASPVSSGVPVAMTEHNTARGVAIPTQKTAPVFDERSELQQALDHMTAKNWIGARNVLHGLAARVPASKQYRALLCYTRGCEAQAAGKGEEAVMELQRALQLDPDLAQAKSALAELLRRR
jgi:hypothetical protein